MTFSIALSLVAAIIMAVIAILINRRKKSDQLLANIGDLDTLDQESNDIINVRKTSNHQVNDDQTEHENHINNTSVGEAANQVKVLTVMANKPHRFAGYDLLQSLLSAGLRFGDMNIFHRHQQTNGKGPILFSLASAVEPGTFDLESMADVATPGLTLFMQLSGTIYDEERFDLMLDTAHQLASDLDGQVCDHQFEPLDTEQVA